MAQQSALMQYRMREKLIGQCTDLNKPHCQAKEGPISPNSRLVYAGLQVIEIRAACIFKTSG